MATIEDIYRLASERRARRAAAEMEKIRNFDCKCQRKHNSNENSDRQQEPAVTSASCSQNLDPTVIWETRRKTAALSRNQRDLVLLGIIKTSMNDSEISEMSLTRCTKRVNATYMVNSVVVCRATFCFVYGIRNAELNALRQHYVENGLKPRQRLRKLHRPSFEDSE